MGELIWVKPSYSRVLAFLNNPTYAGTFVFGRRRKRKSGQLTSGRPRTLLRDPEQWQTVIHDHHPGYIKWEEFERNQTQLRENTAVEANHRGGAVKAGSALLSGLMRVDFVADDVSAIEGFVTSLLITIAWARPRTGVKAAFR
jgi:hypothetical protein